MDRVSRSLDGFCSSPFFSMRLRDTRLACESRVLNLKLSDRWPRCESLMFRTHYLSSKHSSLIASQLQTPEHESDHTSSQQSR